MEAYSSLVAKITQVPALAEYIKEVELQGDFLNLVTENWEERLNNHAIYQDFMDNSVAKFRSTTTTSKNLNMTYQNLKDSQKSLKVFFVTHCKLPSRKSDEDVISGAHLFGSAPLTKIARTMTNDVDPTIHFDGESKVRQTLCSFSNCYDCKSTFLEFKKLKMRFLKNISMPCIVKTKLYDGHEIVNRFYCQLEGQFNLSESFIGLVEVNFNYRYFYVNAEECKTVRVGGTLASIVAIDVAKLFKSKKDKVNFGKIDSIENVYFNDEDVEKPEDDISETDPLKLNFLRTDPCTSGKKRKLEEKERKTEIEEVEERDDDKDEGDFEDETEDIEDETEDIEECVPDTFTEMKKMRKDESKWDETDYLEVEQDSTPLF